MGGHDAGARTDFTAIQHSTAQSLAGGAQARSSQVGAGDDAQSSAGGARARPSRVGADDDGQTSSHAVAEDDGGRCQGQHPVTPAQVTA